MWLTPLATASRSTASPGELHRAVAHAVHDAIAEGEGAGAAEVGHGTNSDVDQLSVPTGLLTANEDADSNSANSS
jgi:hypothetical protein